MRELTLQVNGKNYRGWTSVSVSMGMEQIAGNFDLSVTEVQPGNLDSLRIVPGDSCRVLLGDTVVITGYIDDVCPDYDAESHTVRIAGRDKTGDLVDCAAVHKSGVWHKASLTRIAQDLCAPFGIKVLVATDVGKPLNHSIWHGETAFECLERAARQRGVLLVSNGLGNLVLTRAGKERIATPLIKGKNIERAAGQFSMKDRYSQYIVKGQAPGDSWNTENPDHHLQVKSIVKDDAVQRYRPHVVIADPGDGSTYRDRATWERNVRAGRASRVVYTVKGWEHAGGLWLPNRLVPVQDDFIGFTGDLIIAQVSLRLDETGSHADLDLCRKEAFDLVNLPDKHKAKKGESLKW